jgi:hypothetical protein
MRIHHPQLRVGGDHSEVILVERKKFRLVTRIRSFVPGETTEVLLRPEEVD